MVNTEAKAGSVFGALATSWPTMADPGSDLLKVAAAVADPWPPNKSALVNLVRPSSVAVEEIMPLVSRLCGMVQLLRVGSECRLVSDGSQVVGTVVEGGVGSQGWGGWGDVMMLLSFCCVCACVPQATGVFECVLPSFCCPTLPIWVKCGSLKSIFIR